MIEFFKKLMQSRYVGLLEGEVMRLRAENRALTNSLLGTAGFPPVDFPEAPQLAPDSSVAGRNCEKGSRRGTESVSFTAKKRFHE